MWWTINTYMPLCSTVEHSVMQYKMTLIIFTLILLTIAIAAMLSSGEKKPIKTKNKNLKAQLHSHYIWQNWYYNRVFLLAKFLQSVCQTAGKSCPVDRDLTHQETAASLRAYGMNTNTCKFTLIVNDMNYCILINFLLDITRTTLRQ